MLAKCVVVWVTTSVILASGTTTTTSTERSKARTENDYHGGRPVRPKEFPFLALVQVEELGEKKLVCAGSIPSPTTVLTAAHCDVGDMFVYAGMVSRMDALMKSKNVQERYVDSVAKPIYPLVYDIMICYIRESWDWTEFVAPVSLHLSLKRLQPSFVTRCQVLGFGTDRAAEERYVAHVVDQLIGSSAQCLPLHPFLWFWSFWMCSVDINNKTMCLGDAGGPAVCETRSGRRQWAVSMGVGPDSEGDCQPAKAVNLYVATGPFRSWILSNIKDLPSSAAGIQRSSLKISMFKVLLYLPLWLFLSTTDEVLYLH